MIQKLIDRPVLSSVVSIIILILGILALNNLPVTQYPEIAPPTVQVSANYRGANAETVLESVIIPMEKRIKGEERMNNINSTAGTNGRANMEVAIDQGITPTNAAG